MEERTYVAINKGTSSMTEMFTESDATAAKEYMAMMWGAGWRDRYILATLGGLNDGG